MLGPNPEVSALATPTRPDDSALVISGLVKVFREHPAVNGISLSVPRGSLFGLVGPNGSGKTTTLRMCCGLLRPDAGTVFVDGIDVWSDPNEAKRRLGVVPDPLLLFDRLTGMEQLMHTGTLRGMDRATVAERSAELLDLMGLAEDANAQIHSYSHGMRKKVALAAALLHRPRLLLLDEPFEGVDPVSVVALRAVLDRVRVSGASVVISSHAMDLVERHCDHVAVIAKGSVLAVGPTAEVARGRRLEDAFIDLVGARTLRSDELDWLQADT